MEASGSPPPSQEADLEAPTGSPLREPSDSNLQGSPTSSAAVLTEVRELKVILEERSSSEAALLDAFTKLEAQGTLSTKVLGETLIGRSVNNLAKSSPLPAVREAAVKLVGAWKENHRKRKASAIERSQSMASLDSELAPSPISSLSRVLSQDTMDMIAAPEVNGEPEMEEDKNKLTPKREKIREKLAEAFGQVERLDVKDGSADDATDMKDPKVLAVDIETALNDQLGEKEYVAQARAVLFNLKDKKNHLFRFKLLVEAIRPEHVPKLSAADMASDEKNAERRKQRDDAMAAIDQDWAMKNGQIRISGLFTCGKCKGTQTTYFQMQTRSSDEPMTTFASCLSCGNRWKFC